MNRPRVLITYFSESGHTRAAAKALAEMIDADLEFIETASLGHSLWAWLMRGFAAMRGLRPTIVKPRHDVGFYDLVVLATPVWAGHITSPMRSYVTLQRQNFKRGALLLTLGGNGAGSAFIDLESECKIAPVAHCALTDHDRKTKADHAKLERFARKIKDALACDSVEKVKMAA
ncbi:MAG: hypothetical protein EXR11_00805 [Rhodospirillaceae bacterium]|nr:hypothetical protein [Rhodospirillaceae bacterium]